MVDNSDGEVLSVPIVRDIGLILAKRADTWVRTLLPQGWFCCSDLCVCSESFLLAALVYPVQDVTDDRPAWGVGVDGFAEDPVFVEGLEDTLFLLELEPDFHEFFELNVVGTQVIHGNADIFLEGIDH